MKIVCGWCKKELGEKEPLDIPAVTHGICEECRLEVLRLASPEVADIDQLNLDLEGQKNE